MVEKIEDPQDYEVMDKSDYLDEKFCPNELYGLVRILGRHLFEVFDKPIYPVWHSWVVLNIAIAYIGLYSFSRLAQISHFIEGDGISLVLFWCFHS